MNTDSTSPNLAMKPRGFFHLKLAEITEMIVVERDLSCSTNVYLIQSQQQNNTLISKH